MKKAKGNPIGWCTRTWNPVVGCSKCSPGCAHCYAETMANRLAGMGQVKYQKVIGPKVTGGNGWTGGVYFDESSLQKPYTWKKPRTIFVNSMGDTFHKSVPREWVDKVMDVVYSCHWHKFMLLSKRAEEMAEYFRWKHPNKEIVWPLPNLALGVTAENQDMADLRIPTLLSIPAAMRFVSIEPMLGPVNLDVRWLSPFQEYDPVFRKNARLDWVICGGETGPGARTFPDMAEAIVNLKNQCESAGVPFFYKGPKCIEFYNVRQNLRCFSVKGYTVDGTEYRQRPAGF